MVVVCQRIYNLKRDFLCGKIRDEFKFHLVNRRIVCKPLQCVGLGIFSLVLFNQTLLRRVVDHKHGGMSGVGVRVVSYDC